MAPRTSTRRRPSVYGVASGGGGYVPGAPPPDGGGAPGYVPGGVASTGYVPGVASGGPAPYVPGVASGGPAHVPGVASGGAPVGYVPGAAAAPVYTATASPYIPGVASTGSAPGGAWPPSRGSAVEGAVDGRVRGPTGGRAQGVGGDLDAATRRGVAARRQAASLCSAFVAAAHLSRNFSGKLWGGHDGVVRA